MRVSAELLYHYLSERYPVSRCGRGFRSAALPLPVFYERSQPLVPGEVYITRTQDLPQISHTDCLFLCVGNRPDHIWSYWQGEVFYIEDRELNIFTLFNFVVRFSNK